MPCILTAVRFSLRTCVGHVPHGVFEGPNNGVQHQLKLGWRDGQESSEAVRVHGLEQVEEVSPVLRKLLEVLLQEREKRASLSAGVSLEQKHPPEAQQSHLVDHV